MSLPPRGGTMKPWKKYAQTWSTLQALVTDQVPEGVDLDFKRAAYCDRRKPVEKRAADKDELRRDAVSLSNAGGGALFIGVDEDDHQRAGAVLGIADPLVH